MKLSIGTSLLLLLAASVFAATITPPPQPTTGPGGNNTLYGALQSGPFTVTGQTAAAYTYYIFTPMGLAPGPSNPNPLPTPASAPVILFLHDYNTKQDTTSQPYLAWIAYMTQMGYTVIWPEYQTGPAAKSFLTVILQDFASALVALKAPGLVPPMVDASGKVVYSIVGHQAGGYLAYAVAATAPAHSFPPPKSVFAVEPSQNISIALPAYSAAAVNPRTLVITLVADQQDSVSICNAVTAWGQMTSIPGIYKPFLLFHSDSTGTPAQLGNTVFPLTYSQKDTDPPPNAVDDRDWNITYKLSVAASACAVSGQYCDYALGNGPMNSYGATTQTNMGLWSNGTPVLPMSLLPDPETYFSALACPLP